MTTVAHLWPYLAHFFLEWEMFQTKVVEKIKTSILCSIIFFWTSFRLWDNMEKFGTARQVTDENTCITHRMRIACWIIMAKNIHSDCVIFIAFPLQKWLRERATMSRTYVSCLVISSCHWAASLPHVTSNHSQNCLHQKCQRVPYKEHLKAYDCWG
jgi:hypothetical protein